jgi:hypothetical protein
MWSWFIVNSAKKADGDFASRLQKEYEQILVIVDNDSIDAYEAQRYQALAFMKYVISRVKSFFESDSRLALLEDISQLLRDQDFE